MTIADPDLVKDSKRRRSSSGVRLHHFSVDEYHRMKDFGVFEGDNPIELLGGRLYIKLDYGPPYEVPLGIPPKDIAGVDPEPYPQRRFTVREYHKLLDSGAFPPELRTELVEGWVVDKMTRNAPHDSTLQVAVEMLFKRTGKNWKVRVQSAVTMDDGELEPDIAIVPGPVERFADTHPRPFDVEMVIEVSDTTLSYDRGSKLRDYARNGIRRYLIVNLIHRQVEDYQEPTGPTESPKFLQKRVYKTSELVPLIFGGRKVKPIPVDELIRPI